MLRKCRKIVNTHTGTETREKLSTHAHLHYFHPHTHTHTQSFTIIYIIKGQSTTQGRVFLNWDVVKAEVKLVYYENV